MEAQVHRQERRVGDWVGVAEALVELNAIDDDEVARRRPLGKEVDMVQVQIAVSVARHTAAGAAVHQRRPVRHLVAGQLL